MGPVGIPGNGPPLDEKLYLLLIWAARDICEPGLWQPDGLPAQTDLKLGRRKTDLKYASNSTKTPPGGYLLDEHLNDVGFGNHLRRHKDSCAEMPGK